MAEIFRPSRTIDTQAFEDYIEEIDQRLIFLEERLKEVLSAFRGFSEVLAREL